jgi:hypothetical protein
MGAVPLLPRPTGEERTAQRLLRLLGQAQSSFVWDALCRKLCLGQSAKLL